MLLVQTEVQPSTIPGAHLGLFASEFIPKGTKVWRFQPQYDVVVPQEYLLGMSEASRKQFLNYCYVDKQTNHLSICGDDGRFCNHSDTPNIIQSGGDDKKEGIEIAARDIQKGEELFVDYYEFDEDADRKLGR